MRWDRNKEPGVVARLKRIAELLDLLRQELVQSKLRRIERMAETARYFQGAER